MNNCLYYTVLYSYLPRLTVEQNGRSVYEDRKGVEEMITVHEEYSKHTAIETTTCTCQCDQDHQDQNGAEVQLKTQDESRTKL